MALADTGRAIGAATRAVKSRLGSQTGLNITIGRPEAGGVANPRLNLFLYEALFDGSLKNHSLDEGQQPPLWMVLKFLLGAFDENGESDTEEALDLLGSGLSALQQSNFLSLAGLPVLDQQALRDNPEPLKITFDEASAELISKVMQGPDEKYRLCTAFQVRPVMVTTAEPPDYSLLVGVDYTQTPQVIIGELGVQNAVLPSLGPVIETVLPPRFEIGGEITITGTDLNLAGLSVRLGPVDLPVITQQPGQLRCRVDAAVVNGATISAGSIPLAVVQTLPSGRRRPSNLLVGNLLPTLDLAGATAISGTAANAFGTLDISGKLLGTDQDDVFLALYKDGSVVRLFDALTVPPGLPPAPQTQWRFAMQSTDGVPAGEYLVILRVNGQQAKNSLPVRIVP
jgi:hypothetical protein